MESPKMQPLTQAVASDKTAQETAHQELLLVEVMNGIMASAVIIMMSVIFVNFFSIAMEVPL